MIPKVRACMAAAEAGVRAQIINGTQASALAFCLDGNSQGTTVV
jgi:acetylglutamate kinase